MKCLAILLIISMVLCGCPNNCNGHGKCNNGQCECFRSSGLESIPDGYTGSAAASYNLESYYGPDCSRKMCPMGITFAPIGPTGYNVNLDATATTNTPEAEADRRRIDDQLVQGGPSQPAAPAADKFGVPANHMYAECSGAGICNEETGVCECYDGFEGKACQRMSCPNQCSGKGKCVPISEAVGLTSATGIKDLFGFNGRVDKDGKQSLDTDSEAKFFGCLCDKGFRGPDCSLRECPSGKDPEGATNQVTSSSPPKPNPDSEQRDCSGRGNCNYETGECKCFDGFSGASCSTMSAFM